MLHHIPFLFLKHTLLFYYIVCSLCLSNGVWVKRWHSKCADKINKWNKGKWINEPYQKNRNLFFLDIAKTMARQKNYLILTEGYFDVYSFYDNGLENVVALCGTAISDQQI